MVKRILAGLLLIAVLAGLIGYSQLRLAVEHVSGYLEAEGIRLGSRLGGRIAEVLVEQGDPAAEIVRLANQIRMPMSSWAVTGAKVWREY